MKVVVKRLFFLSLLLNLLFSKASYAQSHGLIFSSFEVAQEKRTSLDLGAGKPLCLGDNFELGFELSFLPNHPAYFGYIFRLINQKGQNIDLMYSPNKEAFNIVIGETLTNITFQVSKDVLFNQWSRLQMKVNKGELSFFVNNKLVNKTKVKLDDDCFRAIFGVCDHPDFKSTDLPPMQLRNVHLLEDGQEEAFWPLREMEGLKAVDSLHDKKATLTNPTWIAPLHLHWQNAYKARVNGNASIAFDSRREELYIIAKDSIYRFALKTGLVSATALASGGHHLLRGNASFFHPQEDRLYNFNIDQQWATAFLHNEKKWEQPFDTAELTEYWHHNRFYSRSGNAMYLMGGYGQLTYKNKVTRYNFATRQWDSLDIKGDDYSPRYLAAVGVSGDSAYILGGFGSLTGEQMLNPKYLYDLILYDVKAQTCKKVRSLETPKEPFVFAHSMIIDSTDQSFYALTFPNDRFDSRLQLIKGSLQSSSYMRLGDTIPYTFRDNKSYADVFFARDSKTLIAVTLFNEWDVSSDVKIYTIAFPPDMLSAEMPVPASGRWKWILLAAGVLLVFGAYAIYRRGKKKDVIPVAPISPVVDNNPVQEKAPQRASIYLFGNFTVTDADGQDITRQFTPLLKEMFLLIVIYTLKHGHGISVENLNEILWNDKSEKAAKNNRSVNMLKLKTILEKLGNGILKKESDKWVFQYAPEEIHIDLAEFFQLAANRSSINKTTIPQILQIVKRGSLLYQTDYPWLDDVKSDISNKVLDILLFAGTTLQTPTDAELLIEIANSIFYFDQVNEQALEIKCKNLIALGRHSLAKNTYEKFAKDYRHMYDEEFPQGYNDIVH